MMKTVYIPKGETVQYESLSTERLVVEGCLKTAYEVKAKTISGNGVICAEAISADVIRARELEANAIICKRLIAQRVEAPEVFASERAVVSCYLSAAYVNAGRVTVALSEVDTMNAQEVIHLVPKKRGLLGTLIASALRAFWTRLTAPSRPVMDAEYTPVSEDGEPSPAGETAAPAEQPDSPGAEEPLDEELNRLVNLFKLARKSGYTLRLIPGTPEENAPVFDLETETIIRPAA